MFYTFSYSLQLKRKKIVRLCVKIDYMEFILINRASSMFTQATQRQSLSNQFNGWRRIQNKLCSNTIWSTSILKHNIRENPFGSTFKISHHPCLLPRFGNIEDLCVVRMVLNAHVVDPSSVRINNAWILAHTTCHNDSY